ncbi:MAG: gamma-glutamyltransferase [Planctomycetales bacterium]
MMAGMIAAAWLVAVGTTVAAAADVGKLEGRTVEAGKGMVVSARPEASRVGVEILKQGGTAVDAAVAVAFALAVTFPEAGNIGGGGFMMIHPPSPAEVVCVEYRETAPGRATRTMFGLKENRHAHRQVGVPGTVRGLALAHKRFGKLPWRKLVSPSVRLAREGFLLDEPLARSLNALVKSSAAFPELRRVYGKSSGKEDWKTGDRFIQLDLADTLDQIAVGGPDAFYLGAVADRIVAEMQAGGGLITKADLAGYRARIRKPIHGTYRGYDVYGPPPPSSGGICLIQMLNMLETFDLRQRDRYSAENLHLIVETMRRAFLDRAKHLGDADFVTIPAHLTTKRYAKRLAAEIDLEKASDSKKLAPEVRLAPESESTTHFSVVDAMGTAVSNTYTLEQSFGSRIVVRGGGFLLNNEMGDFNPVPGHTDRKGRIGTSANQIEPGKRMLSSQTPIIAAKNGHPVLVTGSPGGRTIINTVLGVILGALEFDEDLRQAVDSPRLHHQWLPDQARFEGLNDPKFAETIEKLRQQGHAFHPSARSQGDAHSIWIDLAAGRIFGVADTRRKTGTAAGY